MPLLSKQTRLRLMGALYRHKRPIVDPHTEEYAARDSTHDDTEAFALSLSSIMLDETEHQVDNAIQSWHHYAMEDLDHWYRTCSTHLIAYADDARQRGIIPGEVYDRLLALYSDAIADAQMKRLAI